MGFAAASRDGGEDVASTPRRQPATRSARAARAPAAQRRPRIEKERSSFTSLLTENPNYFGNLVDVPFSPVKEMVGNTRYEALTCVSFNPARNSLQGTLQIKLPHGFSGDLCQTGSREYVRFTSSWSGRCARRATIWFSGT